METNKVYSTLDAYQAGFLQIKGHIPELVEQGSKFALAGTFGLLTALLGGLLYSGIRRYKGGTKE